jgi:aspartyl/asparaginyl-tRNA synthetase
MRVVSFSTLMMFRAGAMDNAEAMMKFVIKKALSDCRKDLEFCDKCYAAWKSGSAER